MLDIFQKLKKASRDQKSEIIEINISNKGLTGSLDWIVDFINLVKLDCSRNKLTNLVITNCPNLKEINCRFNDLTNLIITNQPMLIRLECNHNKQLTKLVVINNPQLIELNCRLCNLTTLEITNNPCLARLSCWTNQLTSLEFLTNLSKENLTYLNIRDNKITGDLAEFSEFINLKNLYLNNNNFTSGDNKVTVSLKLLSCLSKLEELSITNTQITTGLEYLPISLKTICCTDKLAEELVDYKVQFSNYDEYNYQEWRKDHPKLINNAQEIIYWEDIINRLFATLTNELDENGKKSTNYIIKDENPIITKGLTSPNNGFQLWVTNRTSELKKQNQDYYQTAIEVPPK